MQFSRVTNIEVNGQNVGRSKWTQTVRFGKLGDLASLEKYYPAPIAFYSC